MHAARTVRRLAAGLAVTSAVTLAACGGDDASTAAGGGPSAAGLGAADDPIKVGIAAAKTGFLGSWDTDQVRGFEIAAEEINAAGGVDGHQIETEWIDTKTDAATSATAAQELLDNGAEVLVVTCDFDFGSPAAIQAASRGVVAFSLCAGDPKFADTTTIGKFAYTMGAGADVEGSAGAELAWKQGWRTAYVLGDQALDHTKSVERYFSARYEALGGRIVGRDKFTGGDNINVRAQLTRLRSDGADADVVVMSSFAPPAATVLRQIRDAGIDAPVLMPGVAAYGPVMTSVAGVIEDYYTVAPACGIDCKGGDNERAIELVEAYKAKHGEYPGASMHPVMAADLADVLKAGIERAGTTDGEALVKALDSMPPLDLRLGETRFAPTCHKPIGRPLAAMEYQGTSARFIENVQVTDVPDLGDGNGCASL